MLRRRIFASAMASVMALTSVAVVASADETVAAETYVKSKADLETYVKSFDSFRTNELYDYGSTSNENFNKALDFAQNVLDDPESTVDDYTVAYMTLKSVYDHLTIYTADQLKTLLDSCKKIYETNNIYNEELSDEIYKNNKGDVGTNATYDEFVDAYEEAENVINSADSRIITDAYETLNWAKTTLVPYDTVTKAQFRTALKTYEAALQKEFNYQTWTTGKIVDPTWAVQWAFDDLTYTWGVIYNACVGVNESRKNNIKDQYDLLDSVKNATKTSNPAIVGAYQACNNYGIVLNSFVADSAARGSASSVKSLLNKYHGQLVYDYTSDAAKALYAQIDSVLGGKLQVEQCNDKEFTFVDGHGIPNPFAVQVGSAQIVNAASGLHPSWESTTKAIYAAITVKPTEGTVYIKKNADGFADIYDADGAVDSDKLEAAVSASKPGDYKPADYFVINKGGKKDITSLIKVSAADIDDAVSSVDNHEMNYVFDGDTYNVSENDYWTGHWSIKRPVAGSWILGYYWTDDGEYEINEKTHELNVSTGFNGVHKDSQDKTTYAYTTLDKAMELAEFYLTTKKDQLKNQNGLGDASIYELSTIADGSAKGTSEEWGVVYNYLQRALSDKYDASTCYHTKADIVKLIDESYELAEKTGDSAMFQYSHADLVEARQNALAWVKAANSDKGYIENVKPYDFGGASLIADTAYHRLETAYNTLKNDFNAFKYSYGDIYNKVAEIADLIDSGEIEATDVITNGMSDVLYRLFVLRSLDGAISTYSGPGVDTLNNDVFSVDAYFQFNNRVYTWTDEYKPFQVDKDTKVKFARPEADKQNITWEHNELAKAYDALVTAVKAQTDPTVVLGDVNGDGAVTAADASEILKAVVGLRDAVANEVGDFNGDGSVTSADAAAILKSVIGL